MVPTVKQNLASEPRKPLAKLRARSLPRSLFRGGESVAPKAPQQWWLYVLRCGDGSLYCGITTDLVKRLGKHSKGTGARYTRGRGPLTLIRYWPCESMSAALKAELAFKALGRRAKEAKLSSEP